MSSYGDPGPEHRTAVAEVNEARRKAWRAVSEVRKRPPAKHNPHLAPTNEDGSPELSVIATQAAVDYLGQLHPYRRRSRKWDVDFGTISLPETFEKSSPGRGGYTTVLRICRDPEVPVRNLSELSQAANMSVQYSSAIREVGPEQPDRMIKTGTDEYGTILFWDAGLWESVLRGDVGYDEALRRGAEITHAAEPMDEYAQRKLGDPNVSSSPGLGRGPTHTVENYNLVYPERILKQIIQIADEVAAEMDLLIEQGDPDYEPGGGDAA